MKPLRALTNCIHLSAGSIALGFLAAAACTSPAPGLAAPSNVEKCARIVHADVVALDQCLVFNRYGTAMPDGMLFACAATSCRPAAPSSVAHHLPPETSTSQQEAPRPIVLRANEGDCLEICFTNLLGTVNSVVTVKASVHVQGLESSIPWTTMGHGWGLTTTAWLHRRRPPRRNAHPANREPTGSSRERRDLLSLSARVHPFGGANQIEQRSLRHGDRRAQGIDVVSQPGHRGSARTRHA